MAKLSRKRIEALDEWQAICRFAEDMELHYTRQALDAKTFAEKERAAGRVEILQALRTWPRTLETFRDADKHDSALIDSLHSAN